MHPPAPPLQIDTTTGLGFGSGTCHAPQAVGGAPPLQLQQAALVKGAYGVLEAVVAGHAVQRQGHRSTHAVVVQHELLRRNQCRARQIHTRGRGRRGRKGEGGMQVGGRVCAEAHHTTGQGTADGI